MEAKSIRVACYARAAELHAQLARPREIEALADDISAFIGDDLWKLEAFDVAMKRVNRRGTVESVLEVTRAIMAWAVPPPPPKPTFPMRSKKAPRKR